MRRPDAARRLAASLLLVVFLLAGLAFSQGTDEGADSPNSENGNGERSASDLAERFDRAWRLVDERYWGLERTDIDWEAVGAEYRPQALEAEDEDAFYDVLVRMYEELGDDHSVFVPPAQVDEIRELYGTLPCVALFAQRLPDLSGGGRLSNVTYGLTAEGMGYVRLPDLASDGVAGAVRSAVLELEAEGVGGLVLDLRGNPGGRLVTMMEVAGVFTSGFLWRAITGWSIPLPYPAIGFTATELPLAVLVDGNVHSAAEGLAGALQANGRAVVVGETSAGNVEALLPFCLRDGSQAWIATGVLAPIFGRTWEGQGVIPDLPTSSEDAPARAIEWLQEQP